MFGGERPVDDDRSKTDKSVKFDDIVGIDEYKEEILEVLDYLDDQEKYNKLGAQIPKGILLIGAPGTGKTTLGKALANEGNCDFLYSSGADFD